MANNFIETFLSSTDNGKGPGLIKLYHKEQQIAVTGILASEVTVSAQTNYGSLIPDISTLSDLASIAGFASLPMWIGASSLMWRGTQPITFGATMYLVNYAPDLGHEENLRKLTKLCTIYETEGWAAGFTAKVHGGYSTDAFANNKQYQAGSNMWSDVADAYSLASDDQNEDRSSAFSGVFANVKGGLEGTDITGTLTVAIGHKFKMKNILLQKIDVTPSLVEVADNGSDPKPLFYKVDMAFTTCRCGLEKDCDGMF